MLTRMLLAHAQKHHYSYVVASIASTAKYYTHYNVNIYRRMTNNLKLILQYFLNILQCLFEYIGVFITHLNNTFLYQMKYLYSLLLVSIEFMANEELCIQYKLYDK